METQKIANWLGDEGNESLKFATRKWYVINDQNNTDYGEGNEDSTTVKFETKVIKSNLCDYSDAYILVTGDITVDRNNDDVEAAFKNCALFRKWITHVNDEHIDDAAGLDITMPMYNLIEYSDTYWDTSESLWQFKREESPVTDTGNPGDLTTDNSSSFKYKSSLLKEKIITEGQTRVFKGVKIVVPLKYLSNSWTSLEMPLIYCKIHFELSWTKDCVLAKTNANAKFKITNTKSHVPIVTLSSKDNVKLVKLLEDGFNRPVY